MRVLPFLMSRVAVAAAAVSLVGCLDVELAEIRMQLSASPVDSLMLGGIPGYEGTPGQHYEFWVGFADGTMVSAGRFVIIPANAADATAHQVPENAPQLRDYDTREIVGYPNIDCPGQGPCGGSSFFAERDLSTTIMTMVTIEEDEGEDGVPSDNVLLRGPIQPFARGTLRGSMRPPSEASSPDAEVTILVAKDGAQL